VIFAGIDVGGKNLHAVIVNDGTLLAKAEAPSGIKKAEVVERLFDKMLKEAGLKFSDISRIVTTGSSGKRVSFANGYIPDAAADARGTIQLVPSVRTIIDVGAEESRAIKISPEGKVIDFAMNERCAAGTGTFIDSMARTLEMSVEDMAKASLKSTRSIPMNAQCAVFGESEVVSLVHQNVSKEDISRAVHDAVASRVGSIARIVGFEGDIVVIGGVARNVGFIESLGRELGVNIKVPESPDFVGALGAAAAAASGVTEEEVPARIVEMENS